MLTLRVAHSPKSCSESKKVARKLPSRICLGLDLNLAETVLHLVSVTSITPIPHPDSLPHPTSARAQAVRQSPWLAWMPGDLAVRPFKYSFPNG